MKKKSSKLVAWRLSKNARELISDTAKATGLSKTQVVEICVAKHALELPGLADAVKQRLVEIIANELRKHGDVK